jgi:hypothetical protein
MPRMRRKKPFRLGEKLADCRVDRILQFMVVRAALRNTQPDPRRGD